MSVLSEPDTCFVAGVMHWAWRRCSLGELLLMTLSGDQLRAWSLVWTLYWQGAVTTVHPGSFLPHIPPH